MIVHDDTELRRCTRAGVRAGWDNDLAIVDSALRRWSVTLPRTRADGLFGWLTGRLRLLLNAPGAGGEGRPPDAVGARHRGRAFVVCWYEDNHWDAEHPLGVGAVIAVAVMGVVPRDLLATVAGPGNPFAVPVAAVVGTPLYVSGEALVPTAPAAISISES